MKQHVLYVGALHKEGRFSAYIPSIGMEIPISGIFTIESDLQKQLEPLLKDKKIDLLVACGDGIMPVVMKTRKYLRLMGRSVEDYVDTIKVIINEEN